MEPSMSICALCGGEALNDDWAVDIFVRALITRIQSIPREWTSGMNQNQPDLIQRLDACISRASEYEALCDRIRALESQEIDDCMSEGAGM